MMMHPTFPAPARIGNSMVLQRKSHDNGGGLSSSSNAGTRHSHGSCCSSSPSMAVMMDEKYLKHRDHKRHERRRKAMIMFLTTSLILFLTYRHVRHSPHFGGSKGGDDDSVEKRDRRLHVGNNPLKRDSRKRRERMESQQEWQANADTLTTATARRARGAARVGDDGGRTRFDQGGQGDDTGLRQRRYEIVAGYQRREKKELPDVESELEDNNDGGNFLFSFHQKKNPLQDALKALDLHILRNEDHGIRWVDPRLIPALDSSKEERPLLAAARKSMFKMLNQSVKNEFFKAKRMMSDRMEWENQDLATKGLTRDTFVDYTKHRYEYPPKLMEPPSRLGDYPKLMPLKDIMEIWPQDELDHPPETIQEELIHFDFNSPSDLEAARKFRDAKLPFKLVNVPEVVKAGQKWTDEYLAKNFDTSYGVIQAEGMCQESPDNYFAWFQVPIWNVDDMGLPPTRNNDWTFEKWAQHARYADRVGLSPHQPHFYWQSGVDREERHLDPSQWTFVSRDLPSFSSMEPNDLLFEPKSQKGIQCRFAERGLTSATHFDGGRNMVAMMTGAKRYILSPPRECQKLGIVTTRGNPIFRHSMLNFGHLNHMDNPEMPEGERRWLEEAGQAEALSTVLKAGEVLYIPSHWFHYITSVQKSAQCNVRSGIDREGDAFFGGEVDVNEKCTR